MTLHDLGIAIGATLILVGWVGFGFLIGQAMVRRLRADNEQTIKPWSPAQLGVVLVCCIVFAPVVILVVVVMAVLSMIGTAVK